MAASEGPAPPKLAVAMDPGHTPQAKSLQVFSLATTEGRLSVDAEVPVRDESLEAGAMEASEKEIRQLLYVVENLRKNTGADDGEGPAEGDEAGPAEDQATSKG